MYIDTFINQFSDNRYNSTNSIKLYNDLLNLTVMKVNPHKLELIEYKESYHKVYKHIY